MHPDNELVLAADELRKPGAIEAVYFLDARASSSNASFVAGERAARAVHRSFVSTGCTEDERRFERPPLVAFGPFPREREPFALVEADAETLLEEASQPHKGKGHGKGTAVGIR